MKLLVPILALTFLFGLAVPGIAAAQGIPNIDSGFHIIPDASTLDATCPVGAPLSFGAIMHITQNLLGVAIAFAVLIFVIMLAWGGFLLITSAVNAEAKSTARKLLGNAAIGLLVTMSAWLIVDFVMKALYNPNNSAWGPWNSILGDGPACVKKTENMLALFSQEITASQLKVINGENDGSVPDGSVVNGAACPGQDCVSLSPEVPCEASGCRVDKGLKQALVNTKNRSGGWAVTEAYPASRTHKAACHSNGTCVDVGLRPRTYTVQTVTAFYNAAKAAGLRPVYESKSQTFVTELKRNGVNAVYLGDWISADHFSVYSK
jgi:hypothetical protein